MTKLENRADVRELLVGKVQTALNQCTDTQITFFHRMYPGGITNIKTKDLPWAIEQCERTVKKNEIHDV